MTAGDASPRVADVRRRFEHVAWADARLLQALQGAASPPGEAVREFAHIFGAGEVWLARLEGRPPRASVWPELTLAELPALIETVRAGYANYLESLAEAGLERHVAYSNSAGKSFQNSVQDILLQVVLHAQYHRGKVNLLLRQAGFDPAPADFIAFVRGSPAATSPPRSR